MIEIFEENYTKPLLRRCNNISTLDETTQYFYSDCDKSMTAYESNNISYFLDDENKFYTTTINGDIINVFRYDNAEPYDYEHFTLNLGYYTPKNYVICEGYDYFIIKNEKKVKIGVYKGSYYSKIEILTF